MTKLGNSNIKLQHQYKRYEKLYRESRNTINL